MSLSTEQLRRELETLRLENAHLKGVEGELAAAMESLRRSEERLRLAVDAAQMGLWEWDMASNRVEWDARKHHVFGVVDGSFAGTKEAFFELVHPDDRPMLAMAITRAVEDGAPYQNEFRIGTPDGQVRWIANLGQVYRDDEGRPLRMIGVVHDVTTRKLTERALRDSEDQLRAQVDKELREASRMEAVVRLAGGFAHHFNNLLTVIGGQVDMALEISNGEAAQVDLEMIRQAAQRGALLTRQLLTFAGRQVVALKVIDLNDLIEGLGTTLRRLLGGNIELRTQLGSGLWPVTADPSQLELMIMNLAVNAQESMSQGGTLTIRTANVGPDDADAPRGAEVQRGEYVMLAISDTGTGMSDESARQAFEPFFTTKAWGSDSPGLGLSTCYGVVAKQGGHIRVQAELGKGSTFRIYLRRQLPADDSAEGLDA